MDHWYGSQKGQGKTRFLTDPMTAVAKFQCLRHSQRRNLQTVQLLQKRSTLGNREFATNKTHPCCGTLLQCESMSPQNISTCRILQSCSSHNVRWVPLCAATLSTPSFAQLYAPQRRVSYSLGLGKHTAIELSNTSHQAIYIAIL